MNKRLLISCMVLLTGAALDAQSLVVLSAGKLATIDASAPGFASDIVVISNLQPGEAIIGIDYRPASDQLYGLGSTSRVYTLDPGTGVATPVGSQLATLLSGEHFGFDFN